jgi:predicted RNA binding protein YcfA (HicA-like mRNA interferase family)
MRPRELKKILEKAGFVFTRQSGSHAIFKHSITKQRVVLPIHSKDIPKGTLHAILKDAGLNL